MGSPARPDQRHHCDRRRPDRRRFLRGDAVLARTRRRLVERTASLFDVLEFICSTSRSHHWIADCPSARPHSPTLKGSRIAALNDWDGANDVLPSTGSFGQGNEAFPTHQAVAVNPLNPPLLMATGTDGR
jgi:hypothetical protein